MRNALYLVLFFLSMSCVPLQQKQAADLSGTWVRDIPGYEGELVLTRLSETGTRYRFSFEARREAPSGRATFLGQMNDSSFIVDISGNEGYFEEAEPSPSSLAGDPCAVHFRLDSDTLHIETTGCSLVYTGWGVAFDGKYVQVLDSAANE